MSSAMRGVVVLVEGGAQEQPPGELLVPVSAERARARPRGRRRERSSSRFGERECRRQVGRMLAQRALEQGAGTVAVAASRASSLSPAASGSRPGRPCPHSARAHRPSAGTSPQLACGVDIAALACEQGALEHEVGESGEALEHRCGKPVGACEVASSLRRAPHETCDEQRARRPAFTSPTRAGAARTPLEVLAGALPLQQAHVLGARC